MKIYNVMVKASETSPTPYFPFPKAFSSLEAAEDWIDSFSLEMGLHRRAVVLDPMRVYGRANDKYELHFFIYEQEI